MCVFFLFLSIGYSKCSSSAIAALCSPEWELVISNQKTEMLLQPYTEFEFLLAVNQCI